MLRGLSGPKGPFGPEQSRVPEIGWADGVRVGLGWQAVCSEAVQSCRGQAGCPELQRTGWADGVGVAEDSLGRGPEDGLG